VILLPARCEHPSERFAKREVGAYLMDIVTHTVVFPRLGQPLGIG
jgi:hypothetical protein